MLITSGSDEYVDRTRTEVSRTLWNIRERSTAFRGIPAFTMTFWCMKGSSRFVPRYKRASHCTPCLTQHISTNPPYTQHPQYTPSLSCLHQILTSVRTSLTRPWRLSARLSTWPLKTLMRRVCCSPFDLGDLLLTHCCSLSCAPRQRPAQR